MATSPTAIVGIDLGTSHTALASAAGANAAPEIVPIRQWTSVTETDELPLLPSCAYAPLPEEMESSGPEPWIAGELARRRGHEAPTRFVASAKSWLCYHRVNPADAILPWTGSATEEDVATPKLSPVDASALYLRAAVAAWEQRHPGKSLAEQTVVLTVPASFDEAARDHTLKAAKSVGLSPRLLEEPQAAFYDCMDRIGVPALREQLGDEDDQALILIVDIGGGTTDLSLIRAKLGGDTIGLERVAVGDHLLLGGDNMDLALAHHAEKKMKGGKLSPSRFAALAAICRDAKEKLLQEDGPETFAVALAGEGSKLIGGTLRGELTRTEAEGLVLEGFLPVVPLEERAKRPRGGLVALGLPYERDVAITRHVADFVARHADRPVRALLVNGGVFKAKRILDRLRDTLASWWGEAPTLLDNPDPDLAVARGAVAYAKALAGKSVRIKSNAARSYYLGLSSTKSDSPMSALCVLPRGTEEGVVQKVEEPKLTLRLGNTVRFDLFASNRRQDSLGTIIDAADPDLSRLPPVSTRLEGAGKSVDVALEAELSALGTLDLSCVERSADARRHRLLFSLRAPGGPAVPQTSGRHPKSDEACGLIRAVFGKPKPDRPAAPPKQLVRELEKKLGERKSWSLETLRALALPLVETVKGRRQSPDHERVFWLLVGTTLRPGFGHPLDAERIERLLPAFFSGLAFVDETRTWEQLWIAWRRLAAGVVAAEQQNMRDRIDPFLAPEEKRLKKPKAFRGEAPFHLLELASCLERATPPSRAELGDWVLERTWTDRDPRLWAAIGRIGARQPAYADVAHVVAASAAERWLDHLLRQDWKALPSAPRAALDLARVTDDRTRDIAAPLRMRALRRLQSAEAPARWLLALEEAVPLETTDRSAFYGDDLPPGLMIADETSS